MFSKLVNKVINNPIKYDIDYKQSKLDKINNNNK